MPTTTPSSAPACVASVARSERQRKKKRKKGGKSLLAKRSLNLVVQLVRKRQALANLHNNSDVDEVDERDFSSKRARATQRARTRRPHENRKGLACTHTNDARRLAAILTALWSLAKNKSKPKPTPLHAANDRQLLTNVSCERRRHDEFSNNDRSLVKTETAMSV